MLLKMTRNMSKQEIFTEAALGAKLFGDTLAAGEDFAEIGLEEYRGIAEIFHHAGMTADRDIVLANVLDAGEAQLIQLHTTEFAWLGTKLTRAAVILKKQGGTQ